MNFHEQHRNLILLIWISCNSTPFTGFFISIPLESTWDIYFHTKLICQTWGWSSWLWHPIFHMISVRKIPSYHSGVLPYLCAFAGIQKFRQKCLTAYIVEDTFFSPWSLHDNYFYLYPNIVPVWGDVVVSLIVVNLPEEIGIFPTAATSHSILSLKVLFFVKCRALACCKILSIVTLSLLYISY